ncbi:glycoside hydrolase family 78 protein [Actinomadura madurae]|uniref:glycoside hydrolase family 78 protein n=1 Tax=Actinomadura madurae TaxID=1993 RepID=UPI0020263EB6|nr:glycoside hydrolase family 78 protein [Actinomadura madurae]URN04956.1 glycoside hydrolase family 78 protein [Actinomadura madurae]
MRRTPRALRPTSPFLVLPASLLLVVTTAGAVPAAASPGGAVKVVQTRTEYADRPLGLDAARPRLTWRLGSAKRGQAQSAYEVRVASAPSRLSAPDVWDSGKVDSAQSVLVPYAGPGLKPRTRYYWTVRVWDGTGRPSAWRKATWWETGLLDGAALAGEWIGHDAPLPLPTSFTGQNDPSQLKTGTTQGQTFTSDKPVTKVSIPMPTWHTTDADATIALRKDGPGGEILAQRRVVDHSDNAEAALTLDTPAPAGTYYIEQSDPSGQIGWWSHTGGGYDHGQAYTDGEPAPGDRRFSLQTVSSGPDGLTSQLRKDFTVGKKIERARLYSTALGVYTAEINGRRVGHDELTPGWTDYKTRVQYQTYDVTQLLRRGGNAIGATLAPGWYAGHVASFGPGRYGPRPWLRAQLQIDYTDGTSRRIVTDPSWRSATGPVLTSDLLMGERYDAREETPGWSRPGFGAQGWKPVLVNDEATATPVAQSAAPTRIEQEIKPIAVTSPEKGVHIFDLGQNMVGTVRLRVAGQAGTKVTLRHGEVLNKDGTLYTANLRTAEATDTYTLKGGGTETYEPRYTFHGFRYVEVTGYPGTPGKDAVTGRVEHTAEPMTMAFDTDVPMLDQLHRNITWGQRGNFLSVPTDTPARDERLGWSGDINVFSRTATYTMESARFLAKWMRDMRDAQTADGAFTDIAPTVGGLGGGSAGWGDAGVTVPWNLYRAYGDRQVLEQNYPAMQKWISYLESHSDGLLRPASGYGDWLNVDAETPKDVIGTAYFAHAAGLVAQVARVLGRPGDAARYEDLAKRVKEAFTAAYLKDGRLKGDTQTAYVLALSMDLLPADAREAAADRLVELIEARGWHLSTGFLGTPRLLPVLTATGHGDVAYRLLQQRTFPSWGYQIGKGATTMWERWDSIKPDGSFQDAAMNSFNHYAYGAVGEWMYENIAGIAAAEPGYRRTVIRPRPGGDVHRAAATYDSVYGPVSSRWSLRGDRFALDVSVPVNTTAEVWVPAAKADDVAQQGARFLRMQDGAAVFEVGSGSYRFVAKTR